MVYSRQTLEKLAAILKAKSEEYGHTIYLISEEPYREIVVGGFEVPWIPHIYPGVIFTESMLSFLGIVNLGGSTTTSLGTLLSDASSIWTNFPHLMLFPALIISLLMVSFNLFGNGLRDAFNPSLRGVED